MRFKSIVIFLFLIEPVWVLKAQDITAGNKRDLFLNGIYLEDLKMTIPWGTSFFRIGQYGNPRFISTSKWGTIVRWDSVNVFKGVRLNLIYYNNRGILNKKENQKMLSVSASVDSSDMMRLKACFDKYSNMSGQLAKHHKSYEYDWIIDSCSVYLINYKKHGIYLRIQRRLK